MEMGRDDPRFLAVGHLSKPHGTKGELYVWPLTDHPEGVYVPGVVLRLGEPDGDQPDPDLPPLRIEEVRPFRNGFLVFFGGVQDRNDAERLKGRYLYREFEAIEPLADGEFFYHQLLGLEVRLQDGRVVGKVTEVFELSPADLLQVEGPDASHMIPFLPHVIVEVDPQAGVLVIDPPEGLLELGKADDA